MLSPTDLIPVKYRIAAVAGLAVAALLGGLAAGWTMRGKIADGDIAAIRADIAQKREAAVSAARTEERRQQEIVNHALRTQNESIAATADRLRRDLERLRQRPARPAAGVSTAACPDRPCCTGAELCREDGEFLVREAARADETRAGLVGCYEVIDGMASIMIK